MAGIAEVKELLLKEFEQAMRSDPRVSEIYKLLEEGGKLSQKTSYRMAEMTAENLADCFVKQIVMVYDTISVEDALDVLPPLLQKNHDYVAEYAMQVQKHIDEAVDIGVLPVKPEFDAERAANLAESIANIDLKATEETLRLRIDNFSKHIVDESLRKNAQTRQNMGLDIRVVREYDDKGLHKGKDPCVWCLQREGTWTYNEAQEHGVWERHPGCGCTITYLTQKGNVQRLNGLSGMWADI